ncbi:MAG: GNAT family N-acetyltransferase [Anaerolineaceae bacterium]|nr:GNAT family N-acetyltransferase [Anaerolineaceae bacterium]
MLNRIEKEIFPKLLPLFKDLQHHLIIRAVVENTSPGIIYGDHPKHPESIFMIAPEGFFLAGNTDHASFNHTLYEFIQESIIPDLEKEGEDSFDLHYSPEWTGKLDNVFSNKDLPVLNGYGKYYTFDEKKMDWQSSLPDQFKVSRVDEIFLQHQEFSNMPAVKQAITSNWISSEKYYSDGFGFCVQKEDEIISWCMADCVSGSQTEIGIYTDPKFRQKGLGSIAVAATLEYCLQNGLNHIGWHTWYENYGSMGTAIKTGFSMKKAYTFGVYFFDVLNNLGVQGILYLKDEQFIKALRCFNTVFSEIEPNSRDSFYAACAYASISEQDLAWNYLQLAINKGWKDVGTLNRIRFLETLRYSPKWEFLLKSISPDDSIIIL